MIIAIDPGVTHCGVSVVSYKDGKLTIHESLNVKGSLKLKGEHKDIGEKFGERAGKVFRITDYVKNLIDRYKIEAVIMEAPFYNARRPRAFAALLEVVFGIKYIISFTVGIQMSVIAPMAIKKVWSNVGNCGKELMFSTMVDKVKSGEVILPKDMLVSDLTEHQIDSGAVGYTYFKIKEMKEDELIKQDI